MPIAYVWNNVWGWGGEDAAYRLANAGFDVVLCNATHLYFDLSCEKDPRSRAIIGPASSASAPRLNSCRWTTGRMPGKTRWVSP